MDAVGPPRPSAAIPQAAHRVIKSLPIWFYKKAGAGGAADRGRSHLRLFRVNTLDSSNLSTFCDVAGKVPTSATFELLATSVSCLRFLEHLAKEGFEAVNLLATCVLRARMLQLVLRTPYPVLFRGAYVEAVQGDIGRLKTVHAVRQLMQASDQEAWFFTKYIP